MKTANRVLLALASSALLCSGTANAVAIGTTPSIGATVPYPDNPMNEGYSFESLMRMGLIKEHHPLQALRRAVDRRTEATRASAR
jgi:hypothetical protein